MDKETLKALKGSITKWNKIIKGTGKDYGVYNCPLCITFLAATDYMKCSPCPIAKKTKKSRCDGTPYNSWEFHHHKKHEEHFGLKIQCPKCKELAIKERDFIKSLLPVEKP